MALMSMACMHNAEERTETTGMAKEKEKAEVEVIECG